MPPMLQMGLEVQAKEVDFHPVQSAEVIREEPVLGQLGWKQRLQIQHRVVNDT